jgi:CHAD domain-containing protein
LYLWAALSYNQAMLTPEEREKLQNFVDKSAPGTPYLRRARILLLADSGRDAEAISAEVEVPILQTRSLLRAYNRQGLAMFPAELFQEPPLFDAAETMAEAGRKLMAQVWQTFQAQEEAVRERADVTAIHEMRKAIRRLGTICKLFAPYFEEDVLPAYRRRFKKVMRRLGRARDTAIFLEKLSLFMLEAPLGSEELARLQGLHDYWQEQKADFDQTVSRYLGRKKVQAFLEEFGRFTATTGEGAADLTEPETPVQVRHVAPALIYERLAAVRAYNEHLEGASLTELHRLRIQGKELRYTLEFFEPLLGSTAAEVIETVKQLQEHLGQLNDARVALMILDETPAEHEAAVTLYRAAKEGEIRWLQDGLRGLWLELERQSWRQQLGAAVAVL